MRVDRRLEESINGLEVDLRIEILASAMKVLEDPGIQICSGSSSRRATLVEAT